MTKVSVDPSKCKEYGICVGIHPDVFDIPEGSLIAVVTKEVLDDDDLDDVEEAVRACPVQALTLMRADS